MRLSRRLKAGCSLIAISFALATADSALAQSATNEQLYKMILELQVKQRGLESKLKSAEAELKQYRATNRGRAARGEVVPVLVTAQPLPENQAVAAPNARFEVGGGGGSAAGGFGYAGGSFAMPLGPQFGFQSDVIGGLGENNGFAGGAGHLFWRDPNVGMFGLYGNYLYGTGPWGTDGVGMQNARAALEGQAYFDRFTIRGLVGAEYRNYGDTFDFSTKRKTSFFDDIRLVWYATDKFQLNIGHRYSSNRNQLVGGAEYLMDFPSTGTAASVYVDAAYGGRADWDRKADGLKRNGNEFSVVGGAALLLRHRQPIGDEWWTLADRARSQGSAAELYRPRSG